MQADPESAAANALARGDQKAVLEVLMRAYGEPIFRFCRAMLADPNLADDVRQTVFLQAARDLGRFAGQSTFKAWLFGIARHRCLDAARGRRRWWQRFGAGTLDAVEDAAASLPEPDDVLQARAAQAPLDGCLRALTPEARVAVVMRYQEGLSFEEIARALRERPGTIQMRVARALPVLRKCMERKGFFQ